MESSRTVSAWTGVAAAVALVWAPLPGVVALLVSVEANRADARGERDRAQTLAFWARTWCLVSLAVGAFMWPATWGAASLLGWV